ncbi:MAG: hypothetical protein E7211_14235 [Clostridium lundense]|nr:hypothetical protein [Clostridium lundense]
MGLFSKKVDDGILRTNLTFIDGVNMFFKGEVIELSWDEGTKKVTIQSKFENKKTKEKATAHLSVDKITKAAFITEKEILEKQKSVGGRAVVGGLLLGPLGAIVGGMTGLNNKKETQIKNFVVINYNEDKVLTFEIPTTNFNYNKVLQAINKHLHDGELISATEVEL